MSCRKRSVHGDDTPVTKESWYDDMDINLDGKIEENEWQLANGHKDDFEALVAAHDDDGMSIFFSKVVIACIFFHRLQFIVYLNSILKT